MVSLYTFRIRSLIGVTFMSRPQNESVLSQVPEMSQYLMTPLWFLSLWVSVHSLVWLKIRDQLWVCVHSIKPALPIESQLSTALSHQFNSDNWIDQLAGVAFAICVGSVEYNIYKCQRMRDKNYAGLSMGCPYRVSNKSVPICATVRLCFVNRCTIRPCHILSSGYLTTGMFLVRVSPNINKQNNGVTSAAEFRLTVPSQLRVHYGWLNCPVTLHSHSSISGRILHQFPDSPPTCSLPWVCWAC